MQELISYYMGFGLTKEQATRMALDHINSPLSVVHLPAMPPSKTLAADPEFPGVKLQDYHPPAYNDQATDSASFEVSRRETDLVKHMMDQGYTLEHASRIAANVLPLGDKAPEPYRSYIRAVDQNRLGYEQRGLQALADQEVRRMQRSVHPDYLQEVGIAKGNNDVYSHAPAEHYDIEQDPDYKSTLHTYDLLHQYEKENGR